MIFDVTIKNKRYLLKLFNIIIYNDIEYLFLGIIDSTNNAIIPNINCIYIQDSKVVKRNKDNKRIIKFTVDGEPKGKGRPRFRSFGKFVTTYTDAKTKSLETNIRNTYLGYGFDSNLEENIPVDIDIKFYMPIPKSLSEKKKKELIDQPHTKKPDIDNMLKSVYDGLNKAAFADDSQVYCSSNEKLYSLNPRTEVTLRI